MHCHADFANWAERIWGQIAVRGYGDVADDNLERRDDVREPLPESELYDPFTRSFSSRKRQDPLLRLYDKKVVSDDF
jgi:hypothetical protein